MKVARDVVERFGVEPCTVWMLKNSASPSFRMAYTVMAHLVIAYTVMAYIVMAFTGMAVDCVDGERRVPLWPINSWPI